MPNKKRNDLVAKVFIDLDEYQTLLKCKRDYLEFGRKKSEDKEVKLTYDDKNSEVKSTCNCNDEDEDQFGKGIYESSDESETEKEKDDKFGFKKSPEDLTLPKDSKVLLAFIPLRYRNKAKTLLVELLSNLNFSYNSETLEVNLYNKVLIKSNIAKLLLACLDHKTRKRKLHGYDEFLLFLRKENLDRFISNHKGNNEILNNKDQVMPKENLSEVEAINNAKSVYGNNFPWFYIGTDAVN